MNQKKPMLPIQILEKIEPWGRRCRCGAAMQVYASEVHWALIDREVWRQIVTESGHDDALASRMLEGFDCDWYGCSHLQYRCLVCGCRTSDGDALFTAEEAMEVAASQNAAQGLPDFIFPEEIPREKLPSE